MPLEQIKNEFCNYFYKDVHLDTFGNPLPTSLAERDLSRLEMVLGCESMTEDGQQNCRDQIHHALTSRGICSSYNAVPIDDVMADSSYVRLFQKYYRSSITS